MLGHEVASNVQQTSYIAIIAVRVLLLFIIRDRMKKGNNQKLFMPIKPFVIHFIIHTISTSVRAYTTIKKSVVHTNDKHSMGETLGLHNPMQDKKDGN